LAIDFFRRLFFANIDPPRHSWKLQGLPPENMEGKTPLPPHSTEESPQQSEVQNTTTSQEEVPTPLENFRIVSESPKAFRISEGYERRVLQLNSACEFFVVNPSEISTGSHQNPLVNDPFWTADIVRSPPRLVRDLYGTGEGVYVPISYTIPLNHFTVTTTFTATPPVGPNIPSVGPRSTLPLQTAHSTKVPHILTIHAGNAVINQAAIGTPVTPRPTSSLPFGYRALNTPTTATTQVVSGSSIPIQQPEGTGLGRPNPLDGTGQSFTSGSQIPRTLPQAGGHPPTGGKIPFGGHPHAGGQPQFGVYDQLYGQIVSATPNPWNVPFPGNPQFSAGKNSQTPQQPPHGQMPNPTYNPQNQSGYPLLTHASQNTSNPVYLGQNQPHTRGATSYNYPHNLVIGPTNVPMPHQHYPQINRQLPFLATLDLPDLSRLTNDPIYHSPVWPVIPAKLPSDIPKFDGKSGEDPNNHMMTFHLWCSSNSLMDDSIHLLLFQRTLTGSIAKWYIELPCASFHDFNSLAMSFLTHFQLPIRYETGTELLTSLHQTTSVHISDHIHEWRRRRRLIKAVIPDQLLVEWFTKSLLPHIARDVAMGGVVTEEEAIA
jgi:hypothetical protein